MELVGLAVVMVYRRCRLGEANGSTIPSIAAAHPIATERLPTGLEEQRAVIRLQSVRLALGNSSVGKEAI